MKITHTVLKNEDVLSLPMGALFMHRLQNICDVVEVERTLKGKESRPTYIVINTDEPFVDEIIKVLKKHGKWDE